MAGRIQSIPDHLKRAAVEAMKWAQSPEFIEVTKDFDQEMERLSKAYHEQHEAWIKATLDTIPEADRPRAVLYLKESNTLVQWIELDGRLLGRWDGRPRLLQHT